MEATIVALLILGMAAVTVFALRGLPHRRRALSGIAAYALGFCLSMTACWIALYLILGVGRHRLDGRDFLSGQTLILLLTLGMAYVSAMNARLAGSNDGSSTRVAMRLLIWPLNDRAQGERFLRSTPAAMWLAGAILGLVISGAASLIVVLVAFST